MTLPLIFCWFAAYAAAISAPKASDLATALRQLSVDPKQTYRVRELEIVRGDIKIYLTEGVLSFFTPVNGRVVGAIFTTEKSEAGDAEILLLPPARSERASLASFTKSPNLNEHFNSTVLFFSDNTAADLLEQIHRSAIREAPELTPELATSIDPIARSIAGQIDVRLLEALLDNHRVEDGFFFAVIGGRTLGAFDVIYDPAQFEPVSVAQIGAADQEQHFQLWTNFRPRQAPPFVLPDARVSDYRLDTTVNPDLSMAVQAAFRFKAGPQNGRAVPLALSTRLQVTSAAVNGKPVEVFQRPSTRLAEWRNSETFLVVPDTPLVPGQEYEIRVAYAGTVIEKTAVGEYLVSERNTWYPVNGTVFSHFDLIFHYPAQLRLVSTGELVNESTENGERVMHRKTIVPAALAGFNLGEYSAERKTDGPYQVEVYSQNSANSGFDASLSAQTAAILAEYTRRWLPLPIHSIAISPIAGYFGQGFPGLIYLSSVAYRRKEDRPPELRNRRFDTFFNELLLPHEIAHQWWGNIARDADYRTGWLMEAMANDSALEYLKNSKGAAVRDELLDNFRRDLTHEHKGKTVEAAGPVNFGERLIETDGMFAWQAITYEKGAWILRMLRERLGEEPFRALQVRLLQQFASKPLTNEDFRQAASAFVPAGQPDRSLAVFFDTWVYNTGIPALAIRHSGRTYSVQVSDVDDDFIADLPLPCVRTNGQTETHWIRTTAGTNTFDLPGGMAGCELPPSHTFLYSPGH